MTGGDPAMPAAVPLELLTEQPLTEDEAAYVAAARAPNTLRSNSRSRSRARSSDLRSGPGAQACPTST